MKYFLRFCIFGILLSGVVMTSLFANPQRMEYKKNFRDKEQIFLPSKEYYHISAFGYDNLRSDILFLDMVQYIGTYGMYKQSLLFLKDYQIRIARLDPKFCFNYKLAGYILANTDIDGAIKLMKEGFVSCPHYWEIPYQLGYLYMMEKDDTENAEKYYTIASNIPGVLASAPRLAALAAQRSGKYETALTHWSNILKTTDNEDEKLRAIDEIKAIEEQYIASELIKKYLKEKKIPATFDIEALRKQGVLGKIRELPKRLFYFWNEKNQRIEVKYKS